MVAANGKGVPTTKREQIGWMNPETGVMCDCPVYETSPHAKSVPVYREVTKVIRWLRWRWHLLRWRDRDATWHAVHSYGCAACEDR